MNLVELTFRDVFSYRDADIMIHLPRFECLYTVDKNILTILEIPALRRLEIRDNSCWETGVTLPVRMMAFIFCALTFGNLFIVYCDPAFNVDRGNASDHHEDNCRIHVTTLFDTVCETYEYTKKKSRTANTFFLFLLCDLLLLLLLPFPLHFRLHHRLNHLTPNFNPLLKPTLQKRPRNHKPLFIHLKSAKTNRLTPPPSGDDKLEIVRSVPGVVQRRMHGSAQERRGEEEVFRYAQEEPKEGRCGEGEVGVWIDFEVGPRIHHREEGEVRVGPVAGRNDGRRAPVWLVGVGGGSGGARFGRMGSARRLAGVGEAWFGRVG